MPVVVAVFALAATLWGAIYARRGSLLVGCGLLLIVGYALGHDYWNTRVGPISITLDRALLLGLLSVFAYQWRFGGLTFRPWTGCDWMLATLLAILAVSTLFSGQPDVVNAETSKWGRLSANYLLPFVLYLIVRQLDISRRHWIQFLTALVALGIYLSINGAFEVAGRWSFVFPRYIANPELGIHFGRARGPELNSVSLGLYITACLLCAWTLFLYAPRRLFQLALLAVIPLMAAGVFFTYTRSTWIGLIAGGLVVAAFQIPRRWRMPAFAGAAMFGLLFVTASKGQLLDLKREGATGDSKHSVEQRESFAYVSWNMFCDHPIFGVGFGRFFDRKLPYLSDRSQSVELESIRPLQHHNTFLGVLTETGLVGMAAFAGVFVAWLRCAWRLARNAKAAPWECAQGVLMLALVANYFSSAAFHDLTLLPSQGLLLFIFAAVTVNLSQQQSLHLPAARSRNGWHAPRPCEARGGFATNTTPFENSGHVTHVNLFGMQISHITMYQTVAKILIWCREPRERPCRYIVTPNTDHAVLFQEQSALQAAYREASLVLADGLPLVLASRLLGQPLPERVAGSDLVPQIFTANSHSGQTLRVFLLGAGPGVAELAASQIAHRWPGIHVVGTYSPPMGFENDAAENERIFAAVAAAAPNLIVVGLGAPKQEIWVHQHYRQLQANVVICAGATIDFLAGHRRRSPVWMRHLGLEWFYRLCTEPRRLTGRYAHDAWVLPQLIWAAMAPRRCLTGCSRRTHRGYIRCMPANVLVVVVDGLRASALGAYGNTSFATPALDRFAAESLLFDWCYAPAAELNDVYRALWHSIHPARPDNQPSVSLPQMFADRGYATTLVTDEPLLVSLALTAGCDDTVPVCTSLESAAHGKRAADPSKTELARLFAAATDAIEQTTSKKSRLIWVHARGMYGAWDAPLAFQQSLLDEGDPPPVDSSTPPDFIFRPDSDPDDAFRYACAYAAQVMTLDACWESFLPAVSGAAADQWLVMLLGARGFPLGEHQRIGGVDPRLYADQLHVPWLIRFPDNVGRLARNSSLACHLDVLPTLVDWLDRGAHANLFASRDALVSRSASAHAIRTAAWCLREEEKPVGGGALSSIEDASPPPELFVRPDDRWEANDVAKLCPEVVDELRARMASLY